MEEESSSRSLKAYFLPYLTPTHFIPLLQIAKLFATRGVHVVFLTTPHNSLSFRDSIDELVKLGLRISLDYIDFPAKQVGLDEGIESFSSASNREVAGKVLRAFMLMQGPMEDKVRAARPDCIIADMHCFWASDLADELRIPRLVYHGRAYFALCAADSVSRFTPHEKVQSDTEPFLLPGLPDPIHMTRSELPHWVQDPDHGYNRFFDKVSEGDQSSYGVLVNSFYELEKEYADYYRTTVGRRAWCIGPLPLHCDTALSGLSENKGDENKPNRHPCMEWLDQMPAGKVVYVSFGSLSRFSSAQLYELAVGLESSGHPFIWVVRCGEESEEGKKWLPDGFETRIAERKLGVIIKGWAPQVMILEHPSIGGFVTHCGWNSVVEGVTAGLAMVTWPLSAEHFYNRKLVMEVLKIGVDIGNNKWGIMIEESDEIIERDRIEKATRELMSEDPVAKERRRLAREFGQAAKNAVHEGGSSYDNLMLVIEELRRFKTNISECVT